MRHQSLLTLGACALSASACSIGTSAYAAEKPNLLIIHTDEHNFRTLSCYQDILPEEQGFVWGKGMNSTTPNIDRIARSGAICTSYYATSPVSTPSRASFITGLYPQHTGAANNGDFIREDIPTLATILKENGYSTSYVGKWHLEGSVRKHTFTVKYNAGFDDNTYMMTCGHNPYLQMRNGEIIANGLSQKAGEQGPKDEIIHYTDFFTDRTIDIIERDKDKPFCLMVSIPDPHTPDYARPPYKTMYKDLDPQKPATMSPELDAARPAWAQTPGSAKKFNPEPLKQYFGMVKHIDDNIGRILNYLEENDLLENTIVLFTSDHGDMFYEHSRMNKGVPYEASARIPFVISYPKKIPAGKVISTNYVNCDFTPTILGLMGIKSNAKFQGSDTSADFVSKKSVEDEDRFVFFMKSNGEWVAAVEGDYKLVLAKDEVPYLFDLKKDPMELTNYATDPAYKKITANMTKKLIAKLKATSLPSDGYKLSN